MKANYTDQISNSTIRLGKQLFELSQKTEKFPEYDSKEWKRINKTSSYYYYDEPNGFVWLRSFYTIVAVYNQANDKLHIFGRYSSTTYQHIRKFRDALWYDGFRDKYNTKPWDLKEINYMFEDRWGTYYRSLYR